MGDSRFSTERVNLCEDLMLAVSSSTTTVGLNKRLNLDTRPEACGISSRALMSYAIDGPNYGCAVRNFKPASTTENLSFFGYSQLKNWLVSE